MAAKKTRKRAYIPPSAEVVNRRERTETIRTHHSSATRAQRGAAGARGAYVYPTPSWKRTAKRLPVYFLLIFAMQYFLLGQEGNIDGSARVIAAAGFAFVITLCFAPFMHMMDRFAYNRYVKKSGGAQQKPGAKS